MVDSVSPPLSVAAVADERPPGPGNRNPVGGENAALFHTFKRPEQLYKHFDQCGFKHSRINGSHHIFTKDGWGCVPVVIHKGELRPDVLRAVLRTLDNGPTPQGLFSKKSAEDQDSDVVEALRRRSREAAHPPFPKSCVARLNRADVVLVSVEPGESERHRTALDDAVKRREAAITALLQSGEDVRAEAQQLVVQGEYLMALQRIGEILSRGRGTASASMEAGGRGLGDERGSEEQLRPTKNASKKRKKKAKSSTSLPNSGGCGAAGASPADASSASSAAPGAVLPEGGCRDHVWFLHSGEAEDGRVLLSSESSQHEAGHTVAADTAALIEDLVFLRVVALQGLWSRAGSEDPFASIELLDILREALADVDALGRGYSAANRGSAAEMRENLASFVLENVVRSAFDMYFEPGAGGHGLFNKKNLQKDTVSCSAGIEFLFQLSKDEQYFGIDDLWRFWSSEDVRRGQADLTILDVFMEGIRVAFQVRNFDAVERKSDLFVAWAKYSLSRQDTITKVGQKLSCYMRSWASESTFLSDCIAYHEFLHRIVAGPYRKAAELWRSHFGESLWDLQNAVCTGPRSGCYPLFWECNFQADVFSWSVEKRNAMPAEAKHAFLKGLEPLIDFFFAEIETIADRFDLTDSGFDACGQLLPDGYSQAARPDPGKITQWDLVVDFTNILGDVIALVHIFIDLWDDETMVRGARVDAARAATYAVGGRWCARIFEIYLGLWRWDKLVAMTHPDDLYLRYFYGRYGHFPQVCRRLVVVANSLRDLQPSFVETGGTGSYSCLATKIIAAFLEECLERDRSSAKLARVHSGCVARLKESRLPQSEYWLQGFRQPFSIESCTWLLMEAISDNVPFFLSPFLSADDHMRVRGWCSTDPIMVSDVTTRGLSGIRYVRHPSMQMLVLILRASTATESGSFPTPKKIPKKPKELLQKIIAWHQQHPELLTEVDRHVAVLLAAYQTCHAVLKKLPSDILSAVVEQNVPIGVFAASEPRCKDYLRVEEWTFAAVVCMVRAARRLHEIETSTLEDGLRSIFSGNAYMSGGSDYHGRRQRGAHTVNAAAVKNNNLLMELLEIVGGKTMLELCADIGAHECLRGTGA